MALAAKPSSGYQGKGAPHLVFIPSAGMGHLLPFSRFITALASQGVVDISIVTALPTVSEAEADHFASLFAAFPAIRRIDFNLLPLDDATLAGTDPFVLRWESATYGVPMLAWPTLGDQRLIAKVIKSGGFGLWVEHWSWDGGEDTLVRGAEIAQKVKEVMGDEAISARAKEISQEASKAVAEGGSSYRSMQEFLATLR